MEEGMVLKMNITEMLMLHESGKLDYFKLGTPVGKVKQAVNRLKIIAKGNKFDCATCEAKIQMVHPLYGDGKTYYRIEIYDTVFKTWIYEITPRNALGVAELWGSENQFKTPLVTGEWKYVKEWFLK